MGAASTAAASAACSTAPAPEEPEFSAEELRKIGVFERSCESVVFVTNVRSSGPSWFSAPPLYDSPGLPAGSGSGVVWDDKGHIVTNYHVVRVRSICAFT